MIPMIASGGLNQLTAFDFILAGAAALGVGAELIPVEALRARNVVQIRELKVLGMVKEARAQKTEATICFGFIHDNIGNGMKKS